VRRQRQFGDLLLSSDIKQTPICGMPFGSVQLQQPAAAYHADNELVSVSHDTIRYEMLF